MRVVPTLVLSMALLAGCSEDPRDPPAPPKPVAPAPPPAPAPSNPKRLPRLDLITEIRLDLDWDEKAEAAQRRMDGHEFANDAELEKAITAARDAWVKKGKPDVRVTIDSDSRIPWTEVIQTVDLIKRCGIEKVEFAMRAPETSAK